MFIKGNLLELYSYFSYGLFSKYSCLVSKQSFPKSITVAVIKQRARELEVASIGAGEMTWG